MFGQEWFFFWAGGDEALWTVYLPAETAWELEAEEIGLVIEVQE